MAKILVIGDDQGVRRLLDAYCRDKGYDVQRAENGPRGLELFRQDHPDIIVLDLKIRGTDGPASIEPSVFKHLPPLKLSEGMRRMEW